MRLKVLSSLFIGGILCLFAGLNTTSVKAYTQYDTPVHVMTIGGYTGDGELNDPHGIAVNSEGQIYIIDTNNYRIQKFDNDGNFLDKYGELGNSEEDDNILRPESITIDSSDNIYFFDNNRIKKYDKYWNFLWEIGSKGSENGQFIGGEGLHVAEDGNLYVADLLNHRIQVFDSEGNFLWNFGSEGTADGQFDWAQDVTVDADGNIYVIEFFGHRIQKFDSDGNFLLKWGGQGSADGQLYYPNDIEIDSLGNIYITDNYSRIQKFDQSGNFLESLPTTARVESFYFDSLDNIYTVDRDTNRAYIYDNSGNLIKQFGTDMTVDGNFNWPRGVNLDDNKNIYVIDFYNHRVQKFDKNGNFLLNWGEEGTGDNQFNYPLKAVVDSEGYLHILDGGNRRIKKFDQQGNFISAWGETGTEEGQFSFATDIGIDSKDNIYLAEVHNNDRVQKFDKDGNFILTWGETGDGDTQFNRPYGIAVDAEDRVYVFDTYNHKIKIFDDEGNYQGKFGEYGNDEDYQIMSPDTGAVDDNGYIYVSRFDELQKFDAEGSFYGIFGDVGNKPSAMGMIEDVVLDGDDVYIADSLNHRIQKFTYDRIVPAMSVNSFTDSNGLLSTSDFTISGSTTDELSNITSISYRLDGAGDWKVCNSADGALNSLSEGFRCNLSQIADGTHSVQIKSIDSYTNDKIVEKSFTVDVLSPTIRITKLGLIDNVPDLKYMKYYFTSQTPRIEGLSEANSDIFFKVNGETYQTRSDQEGKYTITLNNPSLPRGESVIEYYAVDKVGHISETRTLKLVVGIENFPDDLIGGADDESNTEEDINADDADDQENENSQPEEAEGDTQNTRTIGKYRLIDETGETIEEGTVIINSQEYEVDSQGYVYLEESLSDDEIVNVSRVGDTETYEAKVDGENIRFMVDGEITSPDEKSGEVEEGSESNSLGVVFLLICLLLVVMAVIAFLWQARRNQDN